MAKHRFGPTDFPDRDACEFAAETDIVCGANRLPKLSAALRDRVLTAATLAFHEARRWAHAKQAASLLSFCLLASLLLAPIAALRASGTSFGAPLVAMGSPSAKLSVWALRQNRELLDLPPDVKPNKSPATVHAVLAASSLEHSAAPSSSVPRARLLAVVPASEGWESVIAVTAVRDKLPRAFGIRKL